MVEFCAGVDGQNESLVIINKIPPHLALCSSRVKVRTKVPRHLLERTSCTKVIAYLAFACELECVYHDVRNFEERNELDSCAILSYRQIWGFCKNFYKEIVHGLFLLLRSLIVTHVYLLMRVYLYSVLLIWLAYMEF